MKEKAFAPPEKDAPGEGAPEGTSAATPSPRVAGFILIAAGILLMLLSGWTPGEFPVWENMAAEGSTAVFGTPGDDDLYGEPGDEAIIGGEGDDFIEAKAGNTDHVICGPGEDVASADGLDTVSSDCEVVYRS